MLLSTNDKEEMRMKNCSICGDKIYKGETFEKESEGGITSYAHEICAITQNGCTEIFLTSSEGL
jgi:hypothetical protein